MSFQERATSLQVSGPVTDTLAAVNAFETFGGLWNGMVIRYVTERVGEAVESCLLVPTSTALDGAGTLQSDLRKVSSVDCSDSSFCYPRNFKRRWVEQGGVSHEYPLESMGSKAFLTKLREEVISFWEHISSSRTSQSHPRLVSGQGAPDTYSQQRKMITLGHDVAKVSCADKQNPAWNAFNQPKTISSSRFFQPLLLPNNQPTRHA